MSILLQVAGVAHTGSAACKHLMHGTVSMNNNGCGACWCGLDVHKKASGHEGRGGGGNLFWEFFYCCKILFPSKTMKGECALCGKRKTTAFGKF